MMPWLFIPMGTYHLQKYKYKCLYLCFCSLAIKHNQITQGHTKKHISCAPRNMLGIWFLRDINANTTKYLAWGPVPFSCGGHTATHAPGIGGIWDSVCIPKRWKIHGISFAYLSTNLCMLVHLYIHKLCTCDYLYI